MRRVRVEISGRVQGVFFRASLSERAGELGVGGWARNRDDGTVEACFEGPSDAVERMVAFAREGPPAAEVSGVEVFEEEPEGLERFGTG